MKRGWPFWIIVICDATIVLQAVWYVHATYPDGRWWLVFPWILIYVAVAGLAGSVFKAVIK